MRAALIFAVCGVLVACAANESVVPVEDVQTASAAAVLKTLDIVVVGAVADTDEGRVVMADDVWRVPPNIRLSNVIPARSISFAPGVRVVHGYELNGPGETATYRMEDADAEARLRLEVVGE